MTACMYMSPPIIEGSSRVMPIVLADTLATLVDRETKKYFKGEELTPARFETGRINEPSRVRLVRKLIIEKNFAWACAGDGEKIAQFRKELINQAEDLDVLERPMRRLGDIANDLQDLNVVGAHAKKSRINFVTPNLSRKNHRHLGIYEATGSGAKDLISRCEECANALDHPNWERTNPFMKTAGLVAALNGSRVAEEIIGQHRNKWGGYLEWAYYTGCGWSRGPRTLNVFRFFEAEHDKIIRSGDLAKCIMYEPGDQFGRVLSLAPGANREFILAPAQESGEKPLKPPAYSWSNWEPDWVNVTAVCKVNDRKKNGAHLHVYASKSLDPDRVDDFKFSHGESTTSWEFDREWREDFDSLVEKTLPMFY